MGSVYIFLDNSSPFKSRSVNKWSDQLCTTRKNTQMSDYLGVCKQWWFVGRSYLVAENEFSSTCYHQFSANYNVCTATVTQLLPNGLLTVLSQSFVRSFQGFWGPHVCMPLNYATCFLTLCHNQYPTHA